MCRAHQHAAGARKQSPRKPGKRTRPAQHRADEALGRSRGGLTTKIHLVGEGGLDTALELVEDFHAVAPLTDQLDERDREIIHLRFVEELTPDRRTRRCPPDARLPPVDPHPDPAAREHAHHPLTRCLCGGGPPRPWRARYRCGAVAGPVFHSAAAGEWRGRFALRRRSNCPTPRLLGSSSLGRFTGLPSIRGVVRDRRLAEGWSGTADWIPGSCHGAGSRVTAVKDLAFGNVFAIGGAGADDRCTSTRGSDEWQRSNRLRRPYCRAHAQLARQLHVGCFRGLAHPRNNCMRIHPGSDLTARGNLNIN